MGVKGTSTATQSKPCSKCGETKPLGDFYAAKDCAQWRRPECKKCANAHAAKWRRALYVPKTGRRYDTSPERRAANRAQRERRGGLRRRLDAEARAGVKVCRACNQSKPLDCFKQVKTEPPRFDATCKECRAAKARRRKATTEREV